MEVTDIGCSWFSGEAVLMNARDDRQKRPPKTVADTK